MNADDPRISVSVATIEFVTDAAGGTALAWTEQGAYLDGLDQPSLREEGTTWVLDNMPGYLAPSRGNLMAVAARPTSRHMSNPTHAVGEWPTT